MNFAKFLRTLFLTEQLQWLLLKLIHLNFLVYLSNQRQHRKFFVLRLLFFCRFNRDLCGFGFRARVGSIVLLSISLVIQICAIIDYIYNFWILNYIYSFFKPENITYIPISGPFLVPLTCRNSMIKSDVTLIAFIVKFT